MTMHMLAEGIMDYFVWWQFPLLAILIGLIWFLVWQKKRQM